MTSTVVTKDAQTEEATGTVEADLENARTETGTETKTWVARDKAEDTRS